MWGRGMPPLTVQYEVRYVVHSIGSRRHVRGRAETPLPFEITSRAGAVPCDQS